MTNVIQFPKREEPPKIVVKHCVVNGELFVKESLYFNHNETKLIFSWGLLMGAIAGAMLCSIISWLTT